MTPPTIQTTAERWRVSCVRRTMDGQRWNRIIRESDEWEIAYVPFGDRTPDEYKSSVEHAKLIASAPEMATRLEHLERALTEMREALTDAVAFIRGDISGTGQRNGILCDADDALGQAAHSLNQETSK